MSFTSDTPQEYLDLKKLTLRFARRWKTIVLFVAATVAISLVVALWRPESISSQSFLVTPIVNSLNLSKELYEFTREFIKTDGLQIALASKLGTTDSFRIEGIFQDNSGTITINCIAQDRDVATAAANDVLPVVAEVTAPLLATYKHRYADAAQFFSKSDERMANIELSLAKTKRTLMDSAKDYDKQNELWIETIDQLQATNLQFRQLQNNFDAGYKKSLQDIQVPMIRLITKPHILKPKTKLEQAIIIFAACIGGLMAAILWIIISDWVGTTRKLLRAEKNAS
ncbi:hypothetical protein [Pseudodesulfovibrio methanolicus]|uniref:Lipopolysaccharide biosynthesis protein n=1 Tax=Pseudodesulfovibrio methanolicus TaxID=3126690 RepID=A0ABZ2J0Y7_9BACT